MGMNRHLPRLLSDLMREARLVLALEMLLVLLLLILLVCTDPMTMTIRELLPTTIIIHEPNARPIAIRTGIVHLVLGPTLLTVSR